MFKNDIHLRGVMSKTRTFKEYIIFLEKLIEKDPLFLRNNIRVKLQKYDSPEEKDCNRVLPPNFDS
jgi:hypothetical protein